MKRYFTKHVPVLVIAMIMALMLSVPAFAAGWQQRYERFSAVAGETVVTGDVVCIAATDGKAYKADANDANLRPAVGVIGKGGSTSATVEIVTRGILTGQTAASPGARIFLSETAGGKTASAPTNAQLLGFVMPTASAAASNTVYYINVQLPASTGAAY